MVKIKNITLLIIFYSLLCLISIWGCDFWKTKEEKELILEIKKIEIPLYKNAKNVESFTKNSGLVRGVSYDAKIYYPAKELISFYQDKMAALGFTHFVEGNSAPEVHKWGFYEDGTIKGDPDVAHLNISWVDERKRATLILKYFWYGKADYGIILEHNDNLKILFQIMALK